MFKFGSFRNFDSFILLVELVLGLVEGKWILFFGENGWEVFL